MPNNLPFSRSTVAYNWLKKSIWTLPSSNVPRGDSMARAPSDSAPRVSTLGQPWIPQLNDGRMVFGAGASAWVAPMTWGIMGPMFLSSAISPEPLTDDECQMLETKLEKPIADPARHLIDDASTQFIATVALKNRLPKWKELVTRFDEIVEAGERFVELCTSGESDSPSDSVLSVNQAVNVFLQVNVWGPRQEKPGYEIAFRGTKNIIHVCKQALDAVKAEASKLGPRGDVEFRSFLEAMVIVGYVADAKVTLAPNYKRDDPRTAFFDFVREAIRIVVKKAEIALDRSSLTETERRRASDIFQGCARKKDAALLDQLREVKKEARKRGRRII
jgi:hypothetical protein